MISFISKAEKFPPVLCRLLARVPNGRPMTIEEIAAKSGLPRITVLTLSGSTDWRGVDLYTLKAFTSACGLDFEDFKQTNKALCYLRGTKRSGTRRGPQFTFLRRSPNWAIEFEPRITEWLKTRTKTT